MRKTIRAIADVAPRTISGCAEITLPSLICEITHGVPNHYGEHSLWQWLPHRETLSFFIHVCLQWQSLFTICFHIYKAGSRPARVSLVVSLLHTVLLLSPLSEDSRIGFPEAIAYGQRVYHSTVGSRSAIIMLVTARLIDSGLE